MTTLRSEYSFEQFEEVLQNLAHRIALDAVESLDKGDVRIVIHGPRFSRVETGKCSMNFYAKHASYYETPTLKYKDWWGFDVEEKLYMTSNHRSKISFVEGTDTSETEMKKKRIVEFMDELMAEAGIKPVPRFSLTKYAKG